MNNRTLLALTLAAATALSGAAIAQTTDSASGSGGTMQPVPNPPASTATTSHKAHHKHKKGHKAAAKPAADTAASSSTSSAPSQ